MPTTPPQLKSSRLARPSGRPSWWRRTTLAQLSAVIAISLTAAACSSGTTTAPLALPRKATGHAHRGGTEAGVVSAVTPAALTITSHGSLVTYALTSSTKYREGGNDVTEAAIAVGAHVRLRLAKNKVPAIVASVLVLIPTVSGTVSTLTSAGFKLTSRTAAVHTVVTTSATTFHSGKQTVSESVLKDALHVRVTGQTLPDGSISANIVKVLAAKGG